MTQHRNSGKTGKGGKLKPRIKSHGWGAYKKTIIWSGLSREDAQQKEIEMISLYRTFELGLNSTPGGDFCGNGADHHNAKAVNIFNNDTGEINSFLCIDDAARFLGIHAVCARSVANPNDTKTQTFSPIFNTWFQIKHVEDKTSFKMNMKTPSQLTSDYNRKRVCIVNIDTRIETEFDGVDVAASSLDISPFNIHTTINRYNKQFNVGNDRYDAQYLPKTRDWDYDIIPTNKAKSLAQEKAIVAYDKNNKIVYDFESALKAEESTGITSSNIGKSANHHTMFAGNLRWEFKDFEKRKVIENKRPRKYV
ncbi:GIY-YIG catalytic domain-containing endonuclease [Paramecium bursaria Chlorella virus NW665.2]|nr:GIY-YIG catalytic domain-containing endonuclease [Paramecium bursaria Chlorella virus NW665.2]